MARVGFYKVSIRNTNNPTDDKEISQNISSFSYEDATDVDNMLTLRIRDRAREFADDPIFAEGSYVTFNFGYAQGKISDIFILRVANITMNYEDIVTMEIQATDLGILLKKNKSKKDWSNTKASDIARSIASYHGLKPIIDDTDTVHAFMPQGSKSDYDLLKYLSRIQKSGSWRFYIKNDALYFTRLKLEQESFKTFIYNNGEGEVISFRPYSRETSKNNAARSTIVTSVDPFTNKPIQKSINDTTSKDDVKLGDYAVHTYDGDGKEISGPSKNNSQKRPSKIQSAQNDPDRSGGIIYSPGDSDEIENIGNSEKKGATLHELLADMQVEGIPDIMSDLIVTMNNVSKRDIGNWFINRAKHVISPDGGYILDISMKKNATQKKGKSDNNSALDNVNKTTGKAEPETKKAVGFYTYDEDGKLLSGPAK